VYLGNPWMDGQPDMRWLCLFEPWDGCGKSLVDCGDINGDGVDDIMFGSYDSYSNNQGRVDIWLGDTTFVLNVLDENTRLIPDKFNLLPPYPNPFNSSVTIPFEIFPGLTGNVSLKIYNVLGQEVVDLTVNAPQLISDGSPGCYKVLWDGKDFKGTDSGSGVYLVELKVGTVKQTEKVVLLK
jgi:hypothetical protein